MCTVQLYVDVCEGEYVEATRYNKKAYQIYSEPKNVLHTSIDMHNILFYNKFTDQLMPAFNGIKACTMASSWHKSRYQKWGKHSKSVSHICMQGDVMRKKTSPRRQASHCPFPLSFSYPPPPAKTRTPIIVQHITPLHIYFNTIFLRSSIFAFNLCVN